METLIKAILANYVPTAIVVCLIGGVLAIAISGVIRNSGRHDDVARANFILQTVVVGFIMLFLSGAFVFAIHRIYVSPLYSNVQQNIQDKLPKDEDINNTNLLGSQVQSIPNTIQDPKCLLVVVDTIDCVKKTINDIIGTIIAKMVRGMGYVVGKAIEVFNFNFLFQLPSDVFNMDPSLPADKLQRAINFNNLIQLSEIIGLAFVYLLIVTHYFKSILFSLDSDYSSDFVGDIGKMVLGFAAVFSAKFVAQAIINTASAFAAFLFNTPLANGLTIALQALITDNLWLQFGGFGIALIGLALFVLIYIILFGFVVFKNAKRYFILLLMILLAPIFTPMLFFDMTRNMGLTFWNKFITTSFSLIFDLLILLMIFVFLSSGGFSLSNLLLMLIGMAVVADSNNLISQIAQASEVTGFRSVVRNGIKSGTSTYFNLKRMMYKPPPMPPITPSK